MDEGASAHEPAEAKGIAKDVDQHDHSVKAKPGKLAVLDPRDHRLVDPAGAAQTGLAHPECDACIANHPAEQDHPRLDQLGPVPSAPPWHEDVRISLAAEDADIAAHRPEFNTATFTQPYSALAPDFRIRAVALAARSDSGAAEVLASSA
jgi:hypothetical protein